MGRRRGVVVIVAVLVLAAVGGLLAVRYMNTPADPPKKQAGEPRTVGFNVHVTNERREPIELFVDGQTVGQIKPGEQAGERDVRRPDDGRWRIEAKTLAGAPLWSGDARPGLPLDVRISEFGITYGANPGAGEEEPEEYAE